MEFAQCQEEGSYTLWRAVALCLGPGQDQWASSGREAVCLEQSFGLGWSRACLYTRGMRKSEKK